MTGSVISRAKTGINALDGAGRHLVKPLVEHVIGLLDDVLREGSEYRHFLSDINEGRFGTESLQNLQKLQNTPALRDLADSRTSLQKEAETPIRTPPFSRGKAPLAKSGPTSRPNAGDQIDFATLLGEVARTSDEIALKLQSLSKQIRTRETSAEAARVDRTLELDFGETSGTSR